MATEKTLVHQLIAALQESERYHEQRDWDRVDELIGNLCQYDGDAIAAFVVACISELSLRPDTGPGNVLHNTLKWVVSFLPDKQWQQIVLPAVKALEANRENVGADTVIECASYQQPVALRPYLELLFRIDGNYGQAFWGNPIFHDARWEGVAFLVRDWDTYESDTRRRAAQSLLQTRLPEAFQFVAEQGSEYMDYLPQVGFAPVAERFRQLYPEHPLHLAFPHDYLDRIYGGVPQFPAGTHPTWVQPQGGMHLHRFGGASDFTCGVCGNLGHNLLTLDPVPDDMGVTGLMRLQLATCLSCLGWEHQPLSYAHDTQGHVTDLNASDQLVTPQFPVGPLLETQVGLLDLGPRWKWQQWEEEQNLHRLGGHPVWVQPAEYVRCLSCNRLSTFLLQLESPLVREEDGEDHEWLWGAGGICYVFWCDACKISTIFWQTT